MVTTLEDALDASPEETTERFEKHINPSLASMLSLLGVDKSFVEADGVTVYDAEGDEYLDFLGGYGSLNLGHNPPEVSEAVRAVEDRPNFLQLSLQAVAAALAETLAEVTPGDLEKVFFGTSGSEAVEGALKLARISTGRTKVLTTDEAYHGTTFGALTASGSENHKEPFRPLVPEFETVPFGDADALERALRSEEYACFVVEPIQGEGGIVVPPEGYLAEAERLCEETGALLVVDEVQTGLGRTGELFACEHEDVEPDIMAMAKSLSGSAIPLGAYIATSDVWEAGYSGIDKALLHASTFSNNARGCAAGLKAVELIVERDLPGRAAELGDQFRSDLESVVADHEMLTEVRGRGLMVGLEFYAPMLGADLSRQYLPAMFGALLLREHGIITAYTANDPNVLRLEPPLTVTEDQLTRVVDAIDAVCREYDSFLDVAQSILSDRLLEEFGL